MEYRTPASPRPLDWVTCRHEVKFDIRHLVADGDLVLAHWKATTPAPQPLLRQGHSLFRLRDGKVVPPTL
nr:nuclear transport factor 2 family protein [Myxococcus xanthus]